MKFLEVLAAAALPIVAVFVLATVLPGLMSPVAKYMIPLAVLSVVWLAVGSFIAMRSPSKAQRWLILSACSVGLTVVLAASPFISTLWTSY